MGNIRQQGIPSNYRKSLNQDNSLYNRSLQEKLKTDFILKQRSNKKYTIEGSGNKTQSNKNIMKLTSIRQKKNRNSLPLNDISSQTNIGLNDNNMQELLSYKIKTNNYESKYKKKIYSNGAYYQGELDLNGDFEGTGTLYYPNGQICYQGQWLKNNFHGYGILYSVNLEINDAITINYEDFCKNSSIGTWIKYEGQFKSDQKSGYGILHFRNGDKYQGRFSNDAIEGVGTYYAANKKQEINGYWSKNVLIHND